VENIISRHRNLTILVAMLFAQVLGLAVQVKRPADQGTTRLLRVWTVSAITPVEKLVVHTGRFFSGVWHNYFYVRSLRTQNEALRQEVERLRIEQVRLSEDAGQARRLQALLGFKEQYISQTLPAQVISTTGSDFSRGVYIDKGSRDGLRQDMPVITPDGIVGKVFRVYPTSSLVLEINDPSSGAGVILEKSRLQGILKGTPSGETVLANVMADEQVLPGERLLTSGGDRVYPKGLAVGTISKVSPGGTFLNVKVKPAARLDRLEEVLVITKVVERTPEGAEPAGPVRAVDILAERLPSVPPPKPPEPPKSAGTSNVPRPTDSSPRPTEGGATAQTAKPSPAPNRTRDATAVAPAIPAVTKSRDSGDNATAQPAAAPPKTDPPPTSDARDNSVIAAPKPAAAKVPVEPPKPDSIKEPPR
jgi:rod shape-determining protein MreC